MTDPLHDWTEGLVQRVTDSVWTPSVSGIVPRVADAIRAYVEANPPPRATTQCIDPEGHFGSCSECGAPVETILSDPAAELRGRIAGLREAAKIIERDGIKSAFGDRIRAKADRLEAQAKP